MVGVFRGSTFRTKTSPTWNGFVAGSGEALVGGQDGRIGMETNAPLNVPGRRTGRWCHRHGRFTVLRSESRCTEIASDDRVVRARCGAEPVSPPRRRT